MRRRKIAAARFVVTVSDYNRRHLVEFAGEQAAGKIHRLYNGIDLSRFAFGGEVGGLEEPPLFLSVGRLIEKKGFTHLVEACRILGGEGVAARYLIIGEGPERDALLAQSRATGLEGQIELAGALPQEAVLAAMRRATAIVLPCVISASGDRDGLPTVLLEALAVGVPAISTTTTASPRSLTMGAQACSSRRPIRRDLRGPCARFSQILSLRRGCAAKAGPRRRESSIFARTWRC